MLKKFSWGHGVVLALASFMAFILCLIFLYNRGMKNSELVSNDYYEDELVYQKTIDAKKNADMLPAKPQFVQTAEKIDITFPATSHPEGNRVLMNLFRTDDANLDVKKQMTLDAQRKIILPASILRKGSYTLKLHWEEGKKPYQVDYDVLWK